MNKRLHFNRARAMQAVGHFLRECPGSRMSYLRLLKLLYIADREALKSSGQSITGSSVVAMKHGPVLEDVYDLIRGQNLHADEWAKFFHRDGYELVMHTDPGLSSMTRSITRTIDSVSRRYHNCNEWDMVDVTHEFPEWVENNPGDSVRRIHLGDILKAVGRGEDAEAILENDQKVLG